MDRATVLPDTNIWRYIIDADAVEVIRRAAKLADVSVVACPAVVYESLRVSDPVLRKRLAKALSNKQWVRPMPEAYVQSEDLRLEIARLRPEWLTQSPNPRRWRANRSDWMGWFWRRVRDDPHRMGKFVAGLGKDALTNARTESVDRRREARSAGLSLATLTLDKAEASYDVPVSGWDGKPFEPWRGFAEHRWWRDVVLREHGTFLDWLEEWLELDRIRIDRASWISFWTREASVANLPREWLRWAISEVQALRKVTSGTPVDNQISTYLIDFDVFVTGDKAFADCVDLVRPHAPTPLATMSKSPAGHAAVDHLLELFVQLS